MPVNEQTMGIDSEAMTSFLEMYEGKADPILEAIEVWLAQLIHEDLGKGWAAMHGVGEGYTTREVLMVLNEQCPSVVAEMLRAGAVAYVQAPPLNVPDDVKRVVWPE